MKKRREFLTALSIISAAAFSAPMAEHAGAQSATSGPAAPKKKVPSAAALATAMTFRAFDAMLTDLEIATIAHGIDDARAAARTAKPTSTQLRNSDEMVVRFAAGESVA